jgi:hypothetical protein
VAKQHWLSALGGQATGKQDVGGGKVRPSHNMTLRLISWVRTVAANTP